MSRVFSGIIKLFNKIKNKNIYAKLSQQDVEFEQNIICNIDNLFIDNNFDCKCEFILKTKEEIICDIQIKNKIKNILQTFFTAYDKQIDNKDNIIYINCNYCKKNIYLYEYICCICEKIYNEKCNVYFHANSKDTERKRFNKDFIMHIKECVMKNNKNMINEILHN
jgi:hypothetical protein